MKTDRKKIESFIIKMKFCGLCIDFSGSLVWFWSWAREIQSNVSIIKIFGYRTLWYRVLIQNDSKCIAITHALLLPLRPVGRSFIHGTSFNISLNLTKISYVNKRLPKTTIIERKNESTKRNKKLSSSFYLAVFLSLVYMCVRVIHVIVWVDLDNSNKLNGMQSL